MKNTKLELFNSLTNDNQFIVLFIGKNSQYNDMVQRVYNLHWNSIVTTFNLDENRCGISANQFNELENYRKVFPIGIEDSENRKNLFNKKKLTPISVVSCIEKKQAQYKRTFNKYLDKLHDRLSVVGTLIVDGFTVEEYERLNINQRSYVRIAEEKQIKTAMQEAFEKAGLLVESKSVEKNNVNDLITLLSFCTKLNKGVPIMLALRSCDLDVSNLELLLNLNVVDFVSNDNGDILIYIRSRIEAEILLKDDEEGTGNIVSLIGKLINQIDSRSNDDVVFLIRDILIDIGPNSKDENLKNQFSDYLGEILEYLEECRESGGDPRIILQELTITREYFWNLFNEGAIEQCRLTDALRKSISVGEVVAGDVTLDRSLKYKIIGEISQQKMLTEKHGDITCEGLFFDLSVYELKSIIDNMSEAIQYEPDNSYYYVYWIKAALLLLNNQNVSPEEKSEILEKVLFLDEGLNEEHTPTPYQVLWKIRNVGIEAERRNCYRGEIISSNCSNHRRKESTDFWGPHFVECYVIKNNSCVARARIDVPIE